MKIYKQNELDKLADILKNNGVISVPTDTVYGICGCINSIEAYNKIMEIKNRPSNKALPIMCADEQQIKSIAIVNENAQKLISAFMPGPITLVLNKKQDTLNSSILNSTIAVRMATSEVLKELIYKVNSPLFMTSANVSGEPVCTNVYDIEKVCPDLDGILEGNVSFNKESTIVDCTSEIVKILREGVIPSGQIFEKIIS